MATRDKCSFIGCEGEALDIPDLPYAMCDDHFAFEGMARVKPVTQWSKFWRTVGLFVILVWRESPGGGRMGIALSWSVAKAVNQSEAGQ